MHTYIITNASYEGIMLNLKEKNTTTLVFLLSNSPQVLKIFNDSPVKYYLWRFWYTFTRLLDRGQLSIYSTRALFHKYLVAMKYRWISKFLILSESPSLRDDSVLMKHCKGHVWLWRRIIPVQSVLSSAGQRYLLWFDSHF